MVKINTVRIQAVCLQIILEQLRAIFDIWKGIECFQLTKSAMDKTSGGN